MRARWPAPQRRQRTASTDEHREVPVTDPAELARFAEHDPDATDSGLADAYVDLGPADSLAMDDAPDPDDTGFDDAAQVDLDPA
ncbi:hypothetical protein LWP59_37340 [Amycolatopsis acidiphila]|uniref:Uncharacterized protein n=1 Tax=Amycolatopsis acidiphila TaxID=715473 RepID=A0A557ZXM2_9PSEU|nr:hypothetical protein [Amycolatopsis acidiphila]TVT16769.1 hypothetical protein FNH06_34020 [Amycolatopsis acidiphila]UIJ59625.1 hypothetical protein LWP59_37340 [Amycolatopsis acidiphila]GHG80958.1 hypothetical protein GCM10017788_50480 [Amycolatopsis acidiphila]